jgi:hypothetical protein
MLRDQSVNVHKLTAIKATTSLTFDWFQPKLRRVIFTLHVHVSRFDPIVPIKEQSITAFAQNCWHNR